MNPRSVYVAAAVAIAVTSGLPTASSAQTWAVDVSAGKIVYSPASVDTGTRNLTGTLRYETRHDGLVYGTASMPIGPDAPFWGGGGASARFAAIRGRTGFLAGVELGGHAFSFRDAVVDQTGRGGILEAIPFAGFAVGPGSIEVRGGWRAQTLAFNSVTDKRDVFETGARATYGSIARLQADVKWVHASEGTYPFVGGSVDYSGSSVGVWGHLGKWLASDLDEVTWGGGVTVPIGRGAAVWAMARQEAPDPLFWNEPRRSWSIGVTQQLGRTRIVTMPAPHSGTDGVVIRVSVADTPDGEIQVAGSFNNWKPVPMRREGRDWIVRLSLARGVYQYAFRSAKGEWFVPASVPGRRDDGMGGHVAVLVVQ